MTGLRFLFRVTLRQLDLAAEIYHLREPQKIPEVISRDEARRLLAVASNTGRAFCSNLAYGCGLRASEVVRLKVKHIDSAQNIIRIEQRGGREEGRGEEGEEEERGGGGGGRGRGGGRGKRGGGGRERG